eukprot:g27102.t1
MTCDCLYNIGLVTTGEDFNFDLKLLPVPKLRELTRLIARVRADTGSQLQAGVALDSNDRARFSAPVSQSTQLAAMKESHERELEDKIRVLEQQNEHQQRQIEEQKAQMMQMQAAQAQAQDPRFAPGQNTFGGSSSSIRPTWKARLSVCGIGGLIVTGVDHHFCTSPDRVAAAASSDGPCRSSPDAAALHARCFACTRWVGALLHEPKGWMEDGACGSEDAS